jgi:hypothetical protein
VAAPGFASAVRLRNFRSTEMSTLYSASPSPGKERDPALRPPRYSSPPAPRAIAAWPRPPAVASGRDLRSGPPRARRRRACRRPRWRRWGVARSSGSPQMPVEVGVDTLPRPGPRWRVQDPAGVHLTHLDRPGRIPYPVRPVDAHRLLPNGRISGRGGYCCERSKSIILEE